VDLYLTLSANAPVPSGLLSPEKGSTPAASGTAPPVAPPNTLGLGVQPLTLTANQSWFQSNVCVGNNPSGHNISIQYCDLYNTNIDFFNDQIVWSDYGYYSAGLIDSSATRTGLIDQYYSAGNDVWVLDWDHNIPPGYWYYDWFAHSGAMYNSSTVTGGYSGGYEIVPAGLAEGTCCN